MPILKVVISALEEIPKQFIWKNCRPKIKHETICNTRVKEELKNAGINSITKSFNTRGFRDFMYGDSFHEWKLIPLYVIEQSFGKSFIFYSNLNFKISKLTTFPEYYKRMVMAWKKSFHIIPKLLVIFDRSFYGKIVCLRLEIRSVTLKNFLKKMSINSSYKSTLQRRLRIKTLKRI